MRFLFEVEKAKSGRSSCKGCGAKIEKEAMRVGVRQFVEEKDDGTSAGVDDRTRHAIEGVKWYHPQCCRRFRVSPAWWAANCPKAEAFEGYSLLSSSERKNFQDLVASLATQSEKPKATHDAEASAKTQKRKAASDDESDSASQKDGKRKKKSGSGTSKGPSSAISGLDTQTVLTPDEVSKIASEKCALESKNLAALKEMLRKNNQKISGTKTELLDRVAECKVLGAIPKCEKCKGGFLHFYAASGMYTCRGFQDDTHFVRCTFKSDHVTRSPWKDV